MAKQPKPVSQQPDAAPQEDFSKMHPLLRGGSQVEDMLAAAAKRKEAQEFKIEQLADWKIAINALAATPNGQLMLRTMMQFSGVFAPPMVGNPQSMVVNTLKGAFYLTCIRPYLDPQVRKELE